MDELTEMVQAGFTVVVGPMEDDPNIALVGVDIGPLASRQLLPMVVLPEELPEALQRMRRSIQWGLEQGIRRGG